MKKYTRKGRVLIDLSGQRFGRLTVEKLDTLKPGRVWTCRCDCGKATFASTGCLRAKNKRSCGCLGTRDPKSKVTRHGMVTWPEYKTWLRMKSRCANKNSKDYKYYGGRGIVICERWLDGFSNFIADMGRLPSPEYSIERIDVNGNYDPSNCKWIETSLQKRNTRRTNMVSWNGKSACLKEWSEIFGIGYSTLSARFHRLKLRPPELFAKVSGLFGRGGKK